MAKFGESNWDEIGQRVALADAPFESGAVPAVLENVTFVEAHVEVRVRTALKLIDGTLDVPTPGILRCGIWEWEDGESSTTVRLAELRVSCYSGRARFAFPVVSVFDGSARQRQALRTVGIPCEEGSVKLSLFNDLAVAHIESQRAGTIDVKVALKIELEAGGLQFHLAPLLNYFPAGDKPTLAVTEINHTFEKVKRGTAELNFSGPISDIIRHGEIVQSVMGMVAHGDVQLCEPWSIEISAMAK